MPGRLKAQRQQEAVQQRQAETAKTPARSHGLLGAARQVYLAGLGVFAAGAGQGARLFSSLVSAGEQAEDRYRRWATSAVRPAPGAAREHWDRLEEMFDDRVAEVADQLGVPTKEEVATLERRIEQLNERLRAAPAPRPAPSSRRSQAKGSTTS